MMMNLRSACIVPVVLLVKTWWLVLGLIVWSVPLSWTAVVIADRELYFGQSAQLVEIRALSGRQAGQRVGRLRERWWSGR